MSLLYYSLLRLLLLLAFGGLAYAVGMRGFLLLLVAFLGSGIMSYFVLSRVRGRAGEQVGGFFGRINSRIDAATRAEDDEDPAQVDVTTSDPSDAATEAADAPTSESSSEDKDSSADSSDDNSAPRS